VLTVDFGINGQRFTALNGGPHSNSVKPCHSRYFVNTGRNRQLLGKADQRRKEDQCAGLKTSLECPGNSTEILPELMKDPKELNVLQLLYANEEI